MEKTHLQNKWNVDFLKSMSLTTDPYAENITAEVVADNSFNSLRDLFTSLNNDHQEITSSSLPPYPENYFLQVWGSTCFFLDLGYSVLLTRKLSKFPIISNKKLLSSKL